LNNAPIVEALVDFRVILPKNFEIEQFKRLNEQIRRDFPVAEDRNTVEGVVKFEKDRPAASELRNLGLTGVWIKTTDGKSIGQYRKDGFTFNRLKPYTSWDDILPTALRLWEEYVRLASPELVTRVALRYINRMPLPAATGDLDTLIVTGPRLPQNVPQMLSSFLTRVVIEDADRRLAANVAQALEPGMEDRLPTLLLDIDAYRQGEFPPQGDVLREALIDLHTYKNQIFFGSLQEEFVRRFE
jgi:uncharacterized protein (TIGR04255 family)